MLLGTSGQKEIPIPHMLVLSTLAALYVCYIKAWSQKPMSKAGAHRITPRPMLRNAVWRFNHRYVHKYR